VDAVLRQNLLRAGEGWLSEESVDDPSRLDKSRVWVVDPLDGTREFVAGIPEFCVSIGFVENGRPVAGGICNPATKETIIGSVETGVLYNGKPARPSQRTVLQGALILASRSEVKRGEWQQFQGGDFSDSAHGIRSLQVGPRFRRTRRHHLHTDSQKRVGRCRRRCPGAKRRGFVATLEILLCAATTGIRSCPGCWREGRFCASPCSPLSMVISSPPDWNRVRPPEPPSLLLHFCNG